MKQWRALNLNVTVKTRLLESHLYAQFYYYNRIGGFIEELIEQRNQLTKRKNKRMGGLVDPEKKYENIALSYRIQNTSQVIEEQQKVANAPKMPLKRNGNERNGPKEAQRKRREDERRQVTRAQLMSLMNNRCSDPNKL